MLIQPFKHARVKSLNLLHLKTISITEEWVRTTTSRNWESAWRDQHTQHEWTTPEDTVKALLPTLRNEHVKRVLDLGFGLGRHVILFAREGFETYGIEPTQSGYDYCTQWLHIARLSAIISRGEMATLAFPDEYFDFVISWNVIYHGTLNAIQHALDEISRVTRQSGLIYITLNSTRNEYYGYGREIESNTFLNPDKPDGDLLHHFSDSREVHHLLTNWTILRIRETEQSFRGKIYPDSYHWMIFARKR